MSDQRRKKVATSTAETGHITGTADKDYNIIWFTEACLNNALRLETYIQDAERENDSELTDFFRRAQHESRKGAEQAKALPAQRLGRQATSRSTDGGNDGHDRTGRRGR